MDPDWVGSAATAVAALIAGGALVVAIRANRRADAANAYAAEANEQAAAALDLQRRIDHRASEFRDVGWVIGWSTWTPTDNPPQLQVINGGTTDAREVRVLINTPTHQELFMIGDVRAGETVLLDVHFRLLGPATDHIELVRDTLCRIHWTSPLGFPQEKTIGPARRR